jgi:hypothetical protein
MRYYKIVHDINVPLRWYLGDIRGLNNWIFIHDYSHNRHVPKDLEVELYKYGNEMDFSFTGAYGIPIVSEDVKKCMVEVQNIAFVPVDIDNKTVNKNYYVLIINKILDCVDELRSVFEKFAENDPIRPDKSGEFRYFYTLKIDTSKIHAESEKIFRLGRFNQAIIIDSDLKKKFEMINIAGILYEEV